MRRFNIFDLIGRYYATRLNWFRPMRRLASGNPRDFGKTFVFFYAMYGVSVVIKRQLMKSADKALMEMGANIAAMPFSGKTGEFVTAQFGGGDRIKIALDDESVDWFTVLRDMGDTVLVEDGDQQFPVNKNDILDCEPVF